MATTKLDLTNTNNIEQIVSATPGAGVIPIADGSGKLDEDWLQMTDVQASTLTDGSNADSLHIHNYVDKLHSTSTVVTVPDSTDETTLLSFTLAGGELSTSNAVHIKVPITTFSNSANGATVSFKLKYGSTTIATITENHGASSFTGYSGFLEGIIYADGATGAQTGIWSADFNPNDMVPNIALIGMHTLISGTATEDSTGALTVSVTATKSSNDPSIDVISTGGIATIIK